MSFFDRMPHKFDAVPKEDEIPTIPFLDACAALVPIFGELFGSTAFIARVVSLLVDKYLPRLALDLSLAGLQMLWDRQHLLRSSRILVVTSRSVRQVATSWTSFDFIFGFHCL